MTLEELKRALAGLQPDEFHNLVFQIVQKEYPEAESLAAPDGGADIVVPADSDHGVLVFQVKRFPDRISWSKCRESLDSAVKNYEPEAVMFVFPRNLSKPVRDTFHLELAATAPVEVSYWGLCKPLLEFSRRC